jgi:hypothetical protein
MIVAGLAKRFQATRHSESGKTCEFQELPAFALHDLESLQNLG